MFNKFKDWIGSVNSWKHIGYAWTALIVVDLFMGEFRFALLHALIAYLHFTIYDLKKVAK